MSALKWGQGKGEGAAGPSLFGLPLSSGHFVLPRVLRRPVRILARLGVGDFQAPRFSAAIMSARAARFEQCLWRLSRRPRRWHRSEHHGPHRLSPSIRSRSSAIAQTSEIDILDRLELDGWTSLIGFDAEAARERISGLPWVEHAAVRKVYPHTLEVRVEERDALRALAAEAMICPSSRRIGAVIAPFSGGKQVLLPLLIGAGAPAKAPDFLAKIEKYPELASRVKGYVRVGDRRWDLKLDNGITVKLPEDGEDRRSPSSSRWITTRGCCRAISPPSTCACPTGWSCELTPEAATQREAALNEKPKTPEAQAGDEDMSWLGGHGDASSRRSGTV